MEIKTSDIPGSGLYIDKNGDITIQICQDSRCCKTPILNDENRDEFNLGKMDIFSGNLIGFCDGFRLISGKEVTLNMTHSGITGWLGDYVKIITSETKFHCDLALKIHLFNYSHTTTCTQIALK